MGYRSVVVLAVAGLSVGLLGCCSIWGHGAKHEEDGQAVALAEVPTPARATIQRLVGTGEIKKLDKEETGGKVVYDVEAKVQGKDVEYDVASDGSVLTSEEAVELASLPPVVRAAAERYFGSSEGLKASKEVEEGKTFYEVAGKKGGTKRELKLTETGEIAEEEEGDK